MARIPDLRAADYAEGLANLLPRGRAWRRDPESNLGKLLAGLADPLAQLHARAFALLEREADPAHALELLPEWERAFGLPDPCVPLGSELTLRRAALAAKIGAQGGQSPAYMVAVAEQLGFTITITTFTPSRFGRRFGQPFGGPDWGFTWQVNAPEFVVRRLRFGTPFGEPFATWPTTTLQCVLRRIAPAHTLLTFNYS